MAATVRHIEALCAKAYRFITLDMWLLNRNRLSIPRRWLVATLRVIYMTVATYVREGVGGLASSLCYSTVLSIVPMLAVIVGIAKGFGLQNDVRVALNNALPGHQVELDKIFAYVENYLQQVQGGALHRCRSSSALLHRTDADLYDRGCLQPPLAGPSCSPLDETDH